MKKIVKIISIFVVGLLSLSLTGCDSKVEESTNMNIVTTIFPAYDFARAVVDDTADLTMLLKPGVESHNYDPTPKDIIKIQKSDIFIYNGGESKEWVEKILESLDTSKMTIIKMMDYVETKEEETVEGMQEEEEEETSEEEIEYDEHIWTSPVNAIKIVKAIKDKIVKTDKNNSDLYESNASSYIIYELALDSYKSELFLSVFTILSLIAFTIFIAFTGEVQICSSYSISSSLVSSSSSSCIPSTVSSSFVST